MLKKQKSGYVVEIDTRKCKNLDFSIQKINTQEIVSKRENPDNITETKALTVINKVSLWKKALKYIKKIMNIRESAYNSQEVNNK